MRTSVFVVIPVHNGIEHTLRTVRSLLPLLPPGGRVVVVDDGSRDGTAETLRKECSGVVVLRGDGNLWWSGAINEGVREGYRDGYLRASIVRGPLDRVNTQDNTPAIVYYRIVPGDRLELALLVKGAGCDNMSRVAMLTPADGYEGVTEFVVRCVSEAGPNPSPPLIVGVGIGGTFELAAVLSKRALLRPVGAPNPDPPLAALEADRRVDTP